LCTVRNRSSSQPQSLLTEYKEYLCRATPPGLPVSNQHHLFLRPVQLDGGFALRVVPLDPLDDLTPQLPHGHIPVHHDGSIVHRLPGDGLSDGHERLRLRFRYAHNLRFVAGWRGEEILEGKHTSQSRRDQQDGRGRPITRDVPRSL